MWESREADGQASGGKDTSKEEWLWNTIKDPDHYQNGEAQHVELEQSQVNTK